MAKSTLFLVGVVVAAAISLGAACLYLLSEPPEDDCIGQSHYVIESKRLSESPAKYIQINASDVEQYPLLMEVMEAFDDPENYPGATVQNGTLAFEILEIRTEHRVTDTGDYLLDRVLTKFGPPLDLPIYFFYIGEKSEATYYSWSVVVVDHAC